MKKYLPEISLFLLVAFLNLIAGCTYYKVRSVKPVTSANIAQMPMYKYIILHHGNQSWHLASPSVDNEKQVLSGFIETISNEHLHYMTPKVPGSNRYKYSQVKPEMEVHIYSEEYSELGNNRIAIPLASVNKINLYEPDKGATAASWIFGTIGVILGAYLILVVIILLTKSSCPLVYINDGQTYRFMGETFGGAVNRCSERDDYMPLPSIKPVNGFYDIKIANELQERQYTDLAELLVVDHPDHTSVMVDRHGNIQTLSLLNAPTRATAPGNQECTRALLSRDSLSYLFNQSDNTSPELSSLVLNFDKPADARTAKLLLNTKNSYWLDYIYGKFNENFGTYFNQFAEKQKKAKPEENLQWTLDQGIPLSVYVETGHGWKFVDYVPTPGPLASRDVVVPVDVSDVPGNTMNIRLECGFMFWEVDYAAADFTANTPVTLHKVAVSTAMDENGKDITPYIAKADKEYLYQPKVGNEAILKFNPGSTSTSAKQSVFLHTKGYYEYIRNYTNKPDLAYLRTFKAKGAFAKFSKSHYDLFINDKNFLAKAFTDDAK